MKKPNVAILGATGAVGAEFITLIEERNFPYENLKLLASARSAGTELTVNGKTYVVEEAKPESFENLTPRLFCIIPLFFSGGRSPLHAQPAGHGGDHPVTSGFRIL